MDLVKRLYPLCQRLQVPMEQFVNEAVAQAAARAEEGLESAGTALGVAENCAGAGLTGA